MNFQVTVRDGARRQRYHTYAVAAADADLVELRVAVDPHARRYTQ